MSCSRPGPLVVRVSGSVALVRGRHSGRRRNSLNQRGFRLTLMELPEYAQSQGLRIGDNGSGIRLTLSITGNRTV